MTPCRPRLPSEDEARIARAVTRARERLLEGADPGGRGGAARVIEGALRRMGWSVERCEPAAPARRMAQLAATEPDARRIVLYMPSLRWMAEREGMPDDRLARLEAMALAHEAFHATEEEAAGNGTGGADGEWLWDGPRPARAVVEEAAQRFAEEVVGRIQFLS